MNFEEIQREDEEGLAVKIFDNSDFRYYKVSIERPSRIKAQFTDEAIAGLRFDKSLREPMEWAFEEFGNRVYTELDKLDKDILKGYSFIEEFYRLGHGIIADLWTTRYDEMKNIKIAFPPLPEQTAIIKHIEAESGKIDKAITIQEQMIEKLKEYKATLIDSAVTGKIKVC